MPRKKTTSVSVTKTVEAPIIPVPVEPKVASWVQVRGVTTCGHCKAEPVVNRLGHYELTKFCPHCGYEMLNGR